MDVIPAGIVKDVKDLSKRNEMSSTMIPFSVGLHLQSQGITAHHPVIMVPGVDINGLESCLY